MSRLVQIIASADPETRNRSLDAFCRTASLAELSAECEHLDTFRRHSDNLYERVRALFFLYAIHRFHLPLKAGPGSGTIPFEGYEGLLKRRFEEALDVSIGDEESEACATVRDALDLLRRKTGASEKR